MTLRVVVCGEGRNELGSRFGGDPHQTDEQSGVIEALLRRVRDDGWKIVHGVTWKHIPKLRGHGRSIDESDYIPALMMIAALDHHAEVLAYTRDGDDEVDERHEAHRAGRERGASEVPDLRVVGGIAAPCLEGWILAISGRNKTEAMSKAKALGEASKLFGTKGTKAMVAVVEGCDPTAAPKDATRLHAWWRDAKKALDPSAIDADSRT